MVDYRELLVKYILMVGDAEGVSFIPNWKPDALTEAEYRALRQAEAAANVIYGDRFAE